MSAATIHFASNRALTGAPDQPSSYSATIQPPSISTGLIYGTAFVGGIDIPSNTQGTITQISETNIGAFSPQAIADLQNAGRNLLVFLHGFDNSFSDALTRGAFNREWLAASGVPGADMSVIAFSWPSLGKLISGPILQGDYLQDQNIARVSGTHLMTFLANLEPILTAARAQGRKTYLLAHSMGHLALQSAVEAWFLHGNGDAMLFDAAFLAAGDCGNDAFDQPNLMRLAGLDRLCKRVAIYYSHADHVLQLSAFVNAGAQRLGQDGPENRSDETEFPADTYAMVDATGFQDYGFNILSSHQYYRQSQACRADIASRL